MEAERDFMIKAQDQKMASWSEQVAIPNLILFNIAVNFYQLNCAKLTFFVAGPFFYQNRFLCQKRRFGKMGAELDLIVKLDGQSA